MMNGPQIAPDAASGEPAAPADRVRQNVLMIVLGVALLMFTGCQHEDRAKAALADRVTRLDSTVNTAVRNEAIRPPKLQATLDFAQARLRRDVARFPVTLQRAGELLRADFERFERNQPVYQAEVEEALRGRPERIELNAIYLFL